MDSIADLLATRPVASEPGASGYFSAPSDHLDPSLFGHDEKVHRQVRVLLLSTLYSYWRSVWSEPQAWSTVYLAGSGASYQWNAERSEDGKPGDLDVLIEIDWPQFYAHQPGGILYTPADTAELMDFDLKSNLWPRTAQLHIGRGVYEATFYVNPDPIASIRPYAAYNLSEDRWLVHPDRHPQHPQGTDDYAAIAADRQNAMALVDQYNNAVMLLHCHVPGSPEFTNARAEIYRVSAAADALLGDIHGARNLAFSQIGEGYADNANFRWQANKADGTIAELLSMVALTRAKPSWSPVFANASDTLIQRALGSRQP